MKRVSLPVWALLASLLVFAVAAWRQTRRYADVPLTYQQALAYVDPKLLPAEPEPAALERGDRLLQAAKFLDDPAVNLMWHFSRSSGLAGISAEDQRKASIFLSRHRKDLEMFQAMLEERGPVAFRQEPGASTGRLLNWTDPYLLLSRIAESNGDLDLAAELLGDAASRYAQESRFTGLGLNSFGFYSSITSIRLAARMSLGTRPFSAAQFVSIVRHMPPSPPGSPAIKSCLQFYFRDEVLPEVLDARKGHDNGNGYLYGVNQLDDRVRQTAGYDKVATLKTLADLYRQCVEAADQPWSSRFMSLDAPVQLALKSIPSSLTSSSPPRVSGFWDQISRSYSYRSSPNLLGKLIVVSQGGNATSLAASAPMMRTWYETSRVLFALCAYRKLHPYRLPPNLQDLVKEHLIDAIPSDPYSGKPFRYDPARMILWSTGPDQVDDGGTSATTLTGPADIVVRLF